MGTCPIGIVPTSGPRFAPRQLGRWLRAIRWAHAAPTFVHHWADADLLLSDGGASTLLDVKTVIRTDNSQRTASWCTSWSVTPGSTSPIGGAFASLGLYFARHGVADQLLDNGALLRGRRLQQARGDFLAATQRVLGAEGAQLPA